jgi:phage shock protein C
MPEATPIEPTTPARLRRSSSDRVIAGICGGLGRYFSVDPVIFRIAFVVLALAGGAGIFFYLIAWLVISEERPGEDVGVVRRAEGDRELPLLAGFILVVLGCWLLARAIAPDVFAGKYFSPLILIGLGLLVLARAARR